MRPTQIIPPLSVVRLNHADDQTPHWKNQVGREFRIGYYSRQDGTDCVWLVNDAGQYEQTVDQKQLRDYFVIIERSKERALYGTTRPPIPPLAPSRRPHSNGIKGPCRRPKNRARPGHPALV
jgi:hypothetical protein